MKCQIAAIGEKNRLVCPHQSMAKFARDFRRRSNSLQSAYKIARCIAGLSHNSTICCPFILLTKEIHHEIFKPPVDPTSRMSGLHQKHITYSRLYASVQNTKFFLPLPKVLPCNWPQVFKQTLIRYLGKNLSVLLIGRVINPSMDPNI